MTGKRPVVPEAHEAYLKGRFFWNKRTLEDLLKARQYFDEAIRKDPAFALAYSGLADTWILLNEYADYPPAEALSKARAATLTALELAPDLADAHASLAMCKFCPTASGNFATAFAVDDAWWLDHGAALETRFQTWLAAPH